VRKWTLLPIDFSIQGGELTPTMKLKRKFTEKKFQGFVDEMYSDPKL
jgi:long-chain-fatty-acid--CoA ligase ACSBG